MGIPTVEVLEVCVPSTVFLYNNVKKVENGEKARGTVVFAQGAKIAEAIAKYHDSTAKNASEAFNIFGKYAKESKVLDYAGKGVNWATHNVNPLICASGVYKTLTSDDKVHTGITQLGAISGMFLGEGLMKRNMSNVINEQNVTKLAENIKDIKGLGSIAQTLLKNGNSGKAAAIVKGIAFVCASVTSYDIGEKIATKVADNVCKDMGVEKDNETQQAGKIDRMI